MRALQQGKDVVVVQAPTGSGKTYIFELLYPNLKTQAVFTVPTRALANDKLSEWRTRGKSSSGSLRFHLRWRHVLSLSDVHGRRHREAQLHSSKNRSASNQEGWQ